MAFELETESSTSYPANGFFLKLRKMFINDNGQKTGSNSDYHAILNSAVY